MSPSSKALLVHALTATGAVYAMLALLAATRADWSTMFLWLVIAFATDGIDGPLARKYHVKLHAKRFDGALLDLIIDYLTYVFIPAFALFTAGFLPGVPGWIALGLITFASALYFADTSMKTQDNSFQGFPGCWNMLALVIFALNPGHWTVFILVLALSGAMFLPLKFIHPVRTQRWRTLSLPVALIWTFCATWAAWSGFSQPVWIGWSLLLSSGYLLTAGIAQQLFAPRPTAL